MHNRTGPAVTSFELSGRDGVVLVPLILAIVAFALYPQGALTHSEPAVKAVLAPALQAGGGQQSAEAAP